MTPRWQNRGSLPRVAMPVKSHSTGRSAVLSGRHPQGLLWADSAAIPGSLLSWAECLPSLSPTARSWTDGQLSRLQG